ncbi:MAG: hypothetical protein HKP51_01305 [Sulfitobacter sp.]|nr:hypothetical protein [Sulfitobacter sp.]
MRWVLTVLITAGVAACGADGEPVTPTRDATITLSDNGMSAHTRVGVSKGPLTVMLGVGL